MASQAQPQPQQPEREWQRAAGGFRLTRKRVLAAFLLLTGIFIFIRATASLDGDTETLLTLSANADDGAIRVPTLAYLLAISGLYVVAGGLGVLDAPGLRRSATWLMVLGGILLIPTALIAAAAGGSTNITTMVSVSMRLATPIAIGAMAGLWCERAGVVNIAIEGMMLFGACFGFLALFSLRDVFPDQLRLVQFLAVMAAVLTGGIVALLHAWLSITFRTDQIVSGTVLNILAVGATSFVRRQYLDSTEGSLATLPTIRIPGLSEIPIIGEAFFVGKPIFYLMFLVLVGSHIALYYTRWGLRVRAVGEHPHAADSLGINVNRTRWISVFIGGLIAGLAGAWFSLEDAGIFNDGMTDGKGFISLAALIFGKWTPAGSFMGALLFGFSEALGRRFQFMDVPIPFQFLNMVPYIVTIIVLAGLIGRSQAPKAVGEPYVKE